MSDISESFHVYGASRDDVRSLLNKIDAGGAIVSNERCVSFVLADPSKEDEVIAQSPGIICRFHYAEDHGVWVRFHHLRAALGALSFVWASTSGSKDSFDELGANVSPEIVGELVRAGVLDQQQAGGLQQLVVACHENGIVDGEAVAGDVAALLGFAAYRHFSTQVFLSGGGIDDLLVVHPNAEEVELG